MKFNWKLGPVAICCISSGVFPYLLGFGWKWLYFALFGVVVPFLDLTPKYDRKSLFNVLREVGLSKGKDKNEVTPKILWQKETDTGYEAGLVLPTGVTSFDAQKRSQAVSEALNAKVNFQYDNGRTLMIVNRNKLERFYEFKPSELIPELKGPVEIPIGYSLEGLKTLRFSDEVSAILCGGMSGWGKSSFLRQLIVSLILKNNVDQVKLNLVDLKFGVEFGIFKDCAMVETYIDQPGQVRELVTRLKQEAERRYKLIREKKLFNISKYNQRYEPLPYYLTIIDELASLTDESAINDIIYLGQIGRAAGLMMVIFTQYPTAEVVPSGLKFNCQARLAFKVMTNVNSRVILDIGGAEDLSCPGRAIFLSSKSFEVQVPFLNEEKTLELIAPYERNPEPERSKPEPIKQYDKGVMSLDEWKKWKGI